ncbi:MAG: SAM-dependent chlorinase/fluorinase, partial [Actinomycetota bacterium]
MIRSIAPGTDIADISHLIRPFAVREGAMVLAESVPYFPQSVHLAVVDPGVGSTRRALILSVAEGSLLVGPDNGLLMPSAARLGGVEGAWEILNPDLGLPDRSTTFHGRDVFAPAAAHLVLGVDPNRFGPEVAPESLIRLPVTEVRDLGTCLSGEVVQVDRFGNLQTSFRPRDLAGLAPAPGELLEVRVGGSTLEAILRESYSFGEAGELQ